MQNPPPGPPPDNVPAAPAAGIDRRTGATLIYGLTWVGGLLGLFVFGKDDPELKYHGARALVLWLPLFILTYLIDLVLGFIPVVRVVVPLLFNVALVVLWIYGIYKAWTTRGARFPIPVLGPLVEPYAERVANSV